MNTSIASQLGIGSGIDTRALVRDLASAARAPREAALAQAESTNRARISALASTSSALDTFAKALGELFEGPGFYGTLKSGNDAALGVSLADGARPSGTSVAVRIDALAAGQVSRSATLASATTAIGDGALTLTTASGPHAIALAPGQTGLSAIAAAINAGDHGVTARIATDQAGARLVLAGAEGAANAFSLSADAGSSDALTAFAAGVTSVRAASNAAVNIDGIDLSYASNVVTTALTGVRLTLRATTGSEPVTVSAEAPEATIRSLMGEFVDAYNQLRRALNGATAPGAGGGTGGPLAGDAGVRTMMRALQGMTLTPLAADGAVRTLSDLGVRTGRDGTLSLDAARFDAVYAADPDAVRALLDPRETSSGSPGIAGALDAIRDRVQDRDGPLAGSKARLDRAASQLATAREKMEMADERYRANLERSFTAMEKQMAILSATQAQVKQQIAVWANND